MGCPRFRGPKIIAKALTALLELKDCMPEALLPRCLLSVARQSIYS